MNTEIFLDNASTTKPTKSVIDAMVNVMEKNYANPSSLHKSGFSAEQFIKGVRKDVADMLSCELDEIIFTSGATESNTIAINSAVSTKKRNQNHIVVTSIEHPSVTKPIKRLEEQGFEVTFVSPNIDGVIDPIDIKNAIKEETFLLSTMWVNNETGYILPIAEIGKIAKVHDLLYHVDAVQAFTKVPIKLKNSNIDFLTFSGHKLYAPKGIGVLYINKNVRFVPTTVGGSQEMAKRAGTQNTPGIAGLGQAVIDLKESFEKDITHYKEIKQHLLDNLPESCFVNSKNSDDFIPSIVSMGINGVKAEPLLHFLGEKGIFVSTSSACSGKTGSSIISQIIQNDKLAESTIRVSFSIYTTIEDVDALIVALEEGNNKLRH